MTETVPVTISAKSMQLRFHGCTPDYIRDVCKGRCCRSSESPSGIEVTVLPDEVERIRARGAIVIDGQIEPEPGCRTCPFQTGSFLCGLHGTPDKPFGEKPFGCIASPLTLNSGGKLIIRNRYKLLKCHRDWKDRGLPVYVAFRASFDLLFGEEAQSICDHLAAHPDRDLIANMPRVQYERLRDNDDLHRR